MHPRRFDWLLVIALGASLVMPARAQEILPFPPKPSGSKALPTMQESTYSPLPAERHLPEDAPNILVVLIDDVGPGRRIPTVARSTPRP
jgi:arylsulfatase